ncbi:hypothetical protein EYF80_041855 [Liparis tanakae]|uniref:Uncharacterized protein n=1 Tax=Liparis tanakae TaxID=230148 RepID=A0A4Z2G5U6_9TELE|nr:hypothetical protein EYF80_041855 [Liparis tanakae]
MRGGGGGGGGGGPEGPGGVRRRRDRVANCYRGNAPTPGQKVLSVGGLMLSAEPVSGFLQTALETTLPMSLGQ